MVKPEPMLTASERFHIQVRLNILSEDLETLRSDLDKRDLHRMKRKIAEIKIYLSALQTWMTEKQVLGEEMPSVLGREELKIARRKANTTT